MKIKLVLTAIGIFIVSSCLSTGINNEPSSDNLHEVKQSSIYDDVRIYGKVYFDIEKDNTQYHNGYITLSHKKGKALEEFKSSVISINGIILDFNENRSNTDEVRFSLTDSIPLTPGQDILINIENTYFNEPLLVKGTAQPVPQINLKSEFSYPNASEELLIYMNDYTTLENFYIGATVSKGDSYGSLSSDLKVTEIPYKMKAVDENGNIYKGMNIYGKYEVSISFENYGFNKNSYIRILSVGNQIKNIEFWFL